MKRAYLPFIALVAGFASALLAAGAHSLFFILLPLLAFTFGYFSSRRWALLYSLLLFASYTTPFALYWEAQDLSALSGIFNFVLSTLGAFIISVIGALAPTVRRGLRRPGPVVALAVAVLLTAGCGYLAFPRYSHYYQVTLYSSADLEYLELYLPAATVSGRTYDGLYDHPYRIRGAGLTEDYTSELVATEGGPMLKLVIHGLEATKYAPMPYFANIIFQDGRWGVASPRITRLAPRLDVEPVDATTYQRFFGPILVSQHKELEKLGVPVKVKSNTEAEIELRLENRTGYGAAIHFACGKEGTYTERGRHKGKTSDEWFWAPVEVTSQMGLAGMRFD